jgi:hypothetical protein
MTLAETEPATFRFAAQHLNHCATAVPVTEHMTVKITYHAIFKTLACVSLIAFAVFAIQVETLCRLQCKDTKLPQCNFTIHLSKETNCFQ